MKKSCMLLLLFSILKTAECQNVKPISAGCILTGGSASFYSRTSKQLLFVDQVGEVLFTTRESTFAPDLILGYYILNHLAAGILANASTYAVKYSAQNYADTYKHRSSFLGVGPFIRYSTGFGLFMQASASYSFNKSHYPSDDSKWMSQSYNFGGGYSFFVKGLLSIEPSLSYRYTHVPSYHSGEGEIKTGGLFFALGTYFYFNLK